MKSIHAFVMVAACLCTLAASAAWTGFTTENYVSGPKLTADSLKGKVVLVDMWATWCGPCRRMMPHTEEIAKKFKSRPLVVVGSHVERGFDQAQVAKYVKDNGFSFSFYKGARWDGNVGFDGGIPFLYVIDRSGKVVYGGRDPAEVEKALENALGNAGSSQFIEMSELVAYKSLKGKLVPGKSVESIVKQLNSDIATAEKNPKSETFAKRKAEATKILAAIDEYKQGLLAMIESEISAGAKTEAAKHIDLLVSTWPSLKKEWSAKKSALLKK